MNCVFIMRHLGVNEASKENLNIERELTPRKLLATHITRYIFLLFAISINK